MEKSEFTEEQILHGLPLVEQEAGVSSVLPGGSANAHQTKRAIASRCCAAGLRHSAGSEQHWNGRMGYRRGVKLD